MKIAYLGSKGLPSRSGTERVVEAIASRLSAKHEITIYCDSRYTPKNIKVAGISLIRVLTIKGKYTQAPSLFIFSALHALFSKYDLIHLNGVDASFILPILRLRNKVITTAHGTPGRLTRLKWSKFARWLIRLMEYPFVYLSTYTTSVSYLDAEYLKKRYHRHVFYIPNGVDEKIPYDIQKAERKLEQIDLAPGKYILFAAGRIDPTKGCHLVLEAMNQLGYPLKVVIIGDLNQLQSYSDHLRKIADQRQVVFIPPIHDRELLFGIIKLARIFIFPSTDEGMSMMLLEAATLRAPIVCSDIPENKIALQDNALYFRTGDAVDLAKKIDWAIGHPNEMQELGDHASYCVSDNLAWGKIVEQYNKLYISCSNNQEYS